MSRYEQVTSCDLLCAVFSAISLPVIGLLRASFSKLQGGKAPMASFPLPPSPLKGINYGKVP